MPFTFEPLQHVCCDPPNHKLAIVPVDAPPREAVIDEIIRPDQQSQQEMADDPTCLTHAKLVEVMRRVGWY